MLISASRSSRARSSTTVLVVLLLLLVGCSREDGREKPLSLTSAEARQAAAGFYVGLGRLQFAEQSLISECMRRAGFEYKVQSEATTSALPTDYSDDVAKARSQGYGLAEEKRRTDEAMRLDAGASGLTGEQQKRYRVALSGPSAAARATVRSMEGDVISASTDGCTAAARSTLYGSVKNYLSVSEVNNNTLRSVMYRARANSDAVKKALSEWQSCMASEGFQDLDSRNGARALAVTKYDESPAAAREYELRIATADAQCDSRVGYAKAARNVEDRALARFFTDHESEITAIQEIRRRATANARAALTR